MYTKRIVILLLSLTAYVPMMAQDTTAHSTDTVKALITDTGNIVNAPTADSININELNKDEDQNIIETDIKTYELYVAGKWRELQAYGIEALSRGVDYPLLRMRIGYSAFMLGNLRQSLLQYHKVLDEEPDNKIALYYTYLNNVYLNNITSARFYAAQLPEETRQYEKLKKAKLAALETEYSYKIPDEASRGNAQYVRFGAAIQLGFRTELQQSMAFYNQTISESKYSNITNNQSINIQQKEYYAKLALATSGKLSVLGAFHYLYTPFNNYIYNNVVFTAGIKYSLPYTYWQANVHVGSIGDSSYGQVDGIVTFFPAENSNIYTITKASYGSRFTLSQMVGLKAYKFLWLEGNLTLGSYNKLIDQDGLYLYNDVDTKLFKAGGSIYTSLSNKVILTMNYTFEQKRKVFTSVSNYYQNSINGGLTWKF